MDYDDILDPSDDDIGEEPEPQEDEYNPHIGLRGGEEEYIDLGDREVRLQLLRDFYDMNEDPEARANFLREHFPDDPDIADDIEPPEEPEDRETIKFHTMPDVIDGIYKSVVVSKKEKRDYRKFYKVKSRAIYLLESEEYVKLYKIHNIVNRKVAELIIKYLVFQHLEGREIDLPQIGKIPEQETYDITYRALKAIESCLIPIKPLKRDPSSWVEQKLRRSQTVIASMDFINRVGLPGKQALEDYRKELGIRGDVFPLGNEGHSDIHIGIVNPTHSNDNIFIQLSKIRKDFNELTYEDFKAFFKALGSGRANKLKLGRGHKVRIRTYLEDRGKFPNDIYHPLVDTIYKLLATSLLKAIRDPNKVYKLDQINKILKLYKSSVKEGQKIYIERYYKFKDNKIEVRGLNPIVIEAFGLTNINNIREYSGHERVSEFNFYVDINHPFIKLLSRIIVENREGKLFTHDLNSVEKPELEKILVELFNLKDPDRSIVNRYFENKGKVPSSKRHPAVKFISTLIANWETPESFHERWDDENVMSIGVISRANPGQGWDPEYDDETNLRKDVSKYTKISRFQHPSFKQSLDEIKDIAKIVQGPIRSTTIIEYWMPKVHFVTGLPVYKEKPKELQNIKKGNYVYIKIEMIKTPFGKVFYNRIFIDPFDFIKAWEDTYRSLRIKSYHDRNARAYYDETIRKSQKYFLDNLCKFSKEDPGNEINDKLSSYIENLEAVDDLGEISPDIPVVRHRQPPPVERSVHEANWLEMESWATQMSHATHDYCIVPGYGAVFNRGLDNFIGVRMNNGSQIGKIITKWNQRAYRICKSHFIIPLYIPSIKHTNIILIDHKLKLVYRYEPLGWATHLYDQNEVGKDVEEMSNKLGYRYVSPAEFCLREGPQKEPSPFSGDYAMVFVDTFVNAFMNDPAVPMGDVMKQVNLKEPTYLYDRFGRKTGVPKKVKSIWDKGYINLERCKNDSDPLSGKLLTELDPEAIISLRYKEEYICLDKGGLLQVIQSSPLKFMTPVHKRLVEKDRMMSYLTRLYRIPKLLGGIYVNTDALEELKSEEEVDPMKRIKKGHKRYVLSLVEGEIYTIYHEANPLTVAHHIYNKQNGRRGLNFYLSQSRFAKHRKKIDEFIESNM